MSSTPGEIAIFLEAGTRRVFASALDWPGWARGGKTAELAVEALACYLPRYEPVARAAGLPPPAGGRDTSQIVGHVHGAEVMYARKMGLARDKAAESGPDAAALLRARIAAALQAPAGLETPAGGWPPRCAARRIGWHVLDHLWEIEDKS